ncbi:hypothetical protein K435DRAFT_286283 [Dendrothele bispora CBS 962.96]|uniref:Apoptogenic protein 1, mitochondrial n=1 Tax=Dendrothele bispora (strain CBS 962.96) TaxID=1314807 RepID=A0A4S8LK19_DENBC|nr:hypothetical protein K435DRAFT_286283 [Dendrothele bispora CBS 962.96]
MLLLPRPPGGLSRFSHRLLHVSKPCSKVLVGPPDPISHLRPVIYDDVPKPSPPSLRHHPYSLSEFDPEPERNQSPYELHWKLQRQQLDDLNQNFWLDSNCRFEAAKQAVIEGLPSTASPLDKERALSEFYKQWLMQERSRLDQYTDSWRNRNVACILLSARVHWQKLLRLTGLSK